MKRIILLFSIFIFSLASISADEVMENLKNASDQVAQDLNVLVDNDDIFSGPIIYENIPVVMGDLFSDLLANRLLDNSRFRGNIIKGYSPGTYRISDADWILSGSIYKAGSSYFLSLYLIDPEGNQKKGWEFLIPGGSSETLLEPSRMAISLGGDIYEPNDNSSSAVEMKPDPSIELNNLEIGESGDEDWFYIDIDRTLTESTMFLLEAFTTGGMDTYLEIYSPDDTSYPVAENDDGDDSNARISYAVTDMGRWYIKVRGYSSDETGDYGLTISLEIREAGPGEPDNSIEEAAILNIEGDQLRRTIDYGEDYDFFEITLDRSLPDNKALVIQTYGDLDLTMTLLDSYENEIITNDDSGIDGNPQVMLPGQREGRWYAVVYPYDGDNLGSYTIRAFLIDVEKDDYENDNTMEDASPIEAGGAAQRRTFMPADDEDWVRFVVDQSGEYIIKTTGPMDTYLTLYESNGEYIYDDDDSGNDKNALISQMLDKGVYYIQVTQYEGDGNIEDNYFLSVRKY